MLGCTDLRGWLIELAQAILHSHHPLAKFEEGARLVKVCQEKLAEADVKIQQLEKNAAGEIKLQPFAAEAEA